MERLYSILLRKNCDSIAIKSDDSWISSSSTHWITMGHYNEIIVYETAIGDSFLSRIKKDKTIVADHNTPTEHYHPLHVVPFKSSRICNDASKKFIAIVRIHFPFSTKYTQLSKSVFNRISSIKDVSCNIYYATEFSDMVLDVRSDNLQSLLNEVFSLRHMENSAIGKMYTYIGINKIFLSSNEEYVNNDTIAMVTFRFSGNDMKSTVEQLEFVKANISDAPIGEYHVNGMDDIVLIYKNCPTKYIVSLYRNWYIQNSNKRTEFSIRFATGTTCYSNHHKESIDTDLLNSPVYSDLSSLSQEVSELAYTNRNKMNIGWYNTLIGVSHSIIRMGKTPVMDELVYLMAPGIRAFLYNIKMLFINGNLNEYNDIDRLYSFAEDTSYFIEQMMRIEGQLSHSPEIRPVIYDIPIFMLEYMNSFSYKVSEFLQKGDSEKLNIDFLLVPCPCVTVNATELFSTLDNGAGLIEIKIPENILYNPQESFMAICHEISHYVGERTRNRNLRKQCYCSAIAGLITDQIFNENSDVLLLKMFRRLLLDELEDHNTPTIEVMNLKLSSFFDKMFSEENNILDKILKQYFEYCKQRNSLPSFTEYKTDFHLHDLYETFVVQYWSDVDLLFREVFADICMLHILNIEPKQYIESLIKELSINDTTSTANYVFSIRIFVVLKSMGYVIPNKTDCYNEVWQKLIEIIYSIEEAFKDNQNTSNSCHLSISTINAIYEYGVLSADEVREVLPKNEANEIYNMYNCFDARKFSYTKIIKNIEQWRKSMVKTKQ